MSGNTLKYRMKNENIRDKLEVAPLQDKMRGNHLRWFGYVHTRRLDATIRRINSVKVIGIPKERGRPEKTSTEPATNNLKALNLTDKIVLGRTKWKHNIHIADLR